MFHSGVGKFVFLFECCGLTNVISEFILIFKRSKYSDPKENNFDDDDDDCNGNVSCSSGNGSCTGSSSIIQWYDVLNKPYSDAFSWWLLLSLETVAGFM